MIDKINYRSFQDLKEALSSDEIIIYGDIDDFTNRFIKISIDEYNFECGIVYYDLGVASQFLIIKDSSMLYLGFGKWLIAIDCMKKMDIYKKKLIAAFYEFIQTKKYIIAISELDIFNFDIDGKLRWSSGLRDVIEDFNVIEEKEIIINYSDGCETKFDLEDGRSF